MTSGRSSVQGADWDVVRIRRKLNTVTDTRSGLSVVDAQFVTDIQMTAVGHAEIKLSADKVSQSDRENVRQAVAKAVQGLSGITHVDVRYNGEPSGAGIKLDRSSPSGRPNNSGPAPGSEQHSVRPPGVSRMIAVSSAKGGVGKSTVTVNLARALAARGWRVGVLDADVYGPSLPTMFGRTGMTAGFTADERIMPVEVDQVKTMSIGFIVPEGKAVPWRGPMVMNALVQMLSGVDWGDLDYLFIDMPPGTGDVALTLVQQASIDGAIIVSTPQEVALADVRRGVQFFERTKVPILGLIENMSFHKDVNTGAEIDLFGRGGAQNEARKLGVNFLGEVPFDIGLRKSGDSGTIAGDAIGRVFLALAEGVEQAAAHLGKNK